MEIGSQKEKKNALILTYPLTVTLKAPLRALMVLNTVVTHFGTFIIRS